MNESEINTIKSLLTKIGERAMNYNKYIIDHVAPDADNADLMQILGFVEVAQEILNGIKEQKQYGCIRE